MALQLSCLARLPRTALTIAYGRIMLFYYFILELYVVHNFANGTPSQVMIWIGTPITNGTHVRVNPILFVYSSDCAKHSFC